MFIRKLIILAILVITGLVIFAVLFIMLLLPKFIHVNFNMTNTPNPVTILLIKGDAERLPTYLSEPLISLNPPVNLEDAPYVNCDAILISREQLFESRNDPTVKNQLVSIIMNHKIFLVYHASPVDIANQLDIGMPTSGSNDLFIAVSSAAFSKNSIATGGVLLSKGHSEEYLLRDIRNYVSDLRSKIQQIDTNSSSGDKFIILTPETAP
jgi:hypothetical protein